MTLELRLHHADQIAALVNLDMRAHWTASEAFLKRISKSAIADALTEAEAPGEIVAAIRKAPKGDAPRPPRSTWRFGFRSRCRSTRRGPKPPRRVPSTMISRITTATTRRLSRRARKGRARRWRLPRRAGRARGLTRHAGPLARPAIAARVAFSPASRADWSGVLARKFRRHASCGALHYCCICCN